MTLPSSQARPDSRPPPPRCVRCQYDLAAIAPTDDVGEPAIQCPECGHRNHSGEWETLVGSTSIAAGLRRTLGPVGAWLGLALLLSIVGLVLTLLWTKHDMTGGPVIPCCTMLCVLAAGITGLAVPIDTFFSTAREHTSVWGPHWRVRMTSASAVSVVVALTLVCVGGFFLFAFASWIFR